MNFPYNTDYRMYIILKTPILLSQPQLNLNSTQKNKNVLKEYWILRNILLHFNRIRIFVFIILLPLRGSSIKNVKIIPSQNFNRIYNSDKNKKTYQFLSLLGLKKVNKKLGLSRVKLSSSWNWA